MLVNQRLTKKLNLLPMLLLVIISLFMSCVSQRGIIDYKKYKNYNKDEKLYADTNMIINHLNPSLHVEQPKRDEIIEESQPPCLDSLL